MSTLTWVAGAGGLLGRHVREALGECRELAPWCPPGTRLHWADQRIVKRQLREVAWGLTQKAISGGWRGWAVIWCAGAGVVGTSTDRLDAESEIWEWFLDGLGGALEQAGARAPKGRIVLTSSAGGVYGAGTPPFSEVSPCNPVSEYGRTKLRQEQALAAWSRRRSGVSTLVVRVSNLYGPGQRLDKPQGLISHMARSAIYGRPVHIFVPLDTVRDYLFAEDAGIVMARWTERLGREEATAGAPLHVLKLCASERSTTVSTLVAIFRRIARRQVRVISGLHPSQALQPSQLRFRSRVWTERSAFRTGLLEGISRVYREQLSLYQAGLSTPPSVRLPVPTSETPRECDGTDVALGVPQRFP